MYFWNIKFVHLSILYTVYFSYHMVESYMFLCNYCNIINVNFFIIFFGMLYNCKYDWKCELIDYDYNS